MRQASVKGLTHLPTLLARSTFEDLPLVLAFISSFFHDSKQSFRSNVRSFNPLEKRGCQGRPAPDRGPGVSPGSFPFSRAACGDAQKERKGVFRGIQAPQACLPRTPAKGWPPFAIPLEKRIEVYRTDVLKVCFVSWRGVSPISHENWQTGTLPNTIFRSKTEQAAPL